MSSPSPRAEAIANTAMRLPSAEARAEMLDAACGGDAGLRSEVESLLAARSRGGGDMLELPTLASDAMATIPHRSTPPAPSTVAFRPSPAAAPPLVLDNYRIDREIARGGMGAVLEAEDRELGRKVAMKVMRLESSANEAARARFVREATVLGRLEHPSIVPIHELGRDGEGRLYYTMKLVQGRTLQAILDGLKARDPEDLGHYTLDRLLTVFRKVCDALALAHARGVLHRDLKPENIMVGEFGEVMVMDWGLAKILGEEEARGESLAGLDLSHSTLLSDEERLTRTLVGEVMGTPQFMSPEQAEGLIDELDERSDVYAAGAVLYAILTLRPPVRGGTLAEVLERVRSGDVVPPSRFGTAAAGARSPQQRKTDAAEDSRPLPHLPGGRVPAALASVAMKALRLDPAERYPSIAALALDIEQFQAGFATSAEEAGLMKQLRLLVRRHRREFAVGFTAWLLITALGVWFVFNLRAKERRAVEGEEAATAAALVAGEKSETARRALARSQISLAEAAYRELDGRAMLAALEEVPEDLRDTDWRYLRDRADNSQAGLALEGNAYSVGVAADPTRPGIFAIAPNSNRFVFVEAGSGKVVSEFPASERQRRNSWNRALDISRDGKRLIAGRLGEGGVSIYEIASGKPLVEWDAKDVDQVGFDPGGGRAFVIGAGATLSVHDTETGRELWKSSPVSRATFDLGGKGLIVISGRHVKVLDSATGETVRQYPELPQGAGHLSLAPDGATLYLGFSDGSVRGMKLADGSIPFGRSLTESRTMPRVAATADGAGLVAVADLPGGRRIGRAWSLATGIPYWTLMGSSGQIEAFAVHPLTHDILVSGPDPRSWSLQTRMPRSVIFGGSISSGSFWGGEDLLLARAQPLKADPGGKWNAVELPLPSDLAARIDRADSGGGGIAVLAAYEPMEEGNLVVLKRTPDGVEVLHRLRSKENVSKLRVSPDGARFAVVNAYCRIEAFDTGTGRSLWTYEGTVLRNLRDLEWLGSDRLVAVGNSSTRGLADNEERVVLWDGGTGEMLRHASHPTALNEVATAADGSLIAEGGEDKRVRLRDPATLEVMGEFRAHDERITSLALHPVRRVLASASADRRLRFWNLDDFGLIEEVNDGLVEKVRLAFSPDGARLASITSEGRVSVFDLDSPPLGDSTRSMEKAVTVRDISQSRAIGTAQARAGNFPAARNALAEVVSLAGAMPMDWGRLIMVEAALGGAESCRGRAETMLARFEDLTEPMEMERAAKFALVVPLSAESRETALRLAHGAIAAAPDHQYRAYFQFVDGLAHYREENFAEAIEVLTPLLEAAPNDVRVQAAPVLAMAARGLGRRDEARDLLAKAGELAATLHPAPDAADLGPSWHDVLLARMLLEEARALVDPDADQRLNPGR